MMDRRRFIRDSAGLTAFFVMGPAVVLAAATTSPGGLPEGLLSNAASDSWLKLGRDGKVNLFAGKVEFGQGILTAFAQLVAEELEVSIARIRIVQADTELCPDLGYTMGSRSIEQGGTALQRVAAELKAMLVGNAAKRLGMAAGRLGVVDGAFLVDGKPADLTYWQLLGDNEFVTRTYSDETRLKKAADYRIVGISVPRFDIPDKAFGRAAFIQDQRMPGMLHARIVRPPDHGAELVRMNDKLGAWSSSVQVVRDKSFVAVVGQREEQVVQAALLLARNCKWTEGRQLPDEDHLADWLRTVAEPAEVVVKSGLTTSAKTGTQKVKFTRAFQAHASMAPSVGIARKEAGKLTIWTHAQGVFPLRGAIARIVGLNEADVHCVHVPSCGNYGHNGSDDAACDAAIIAARLPGKTIRLQYSREDEFSREPYGPAMIVEVEGSLGRDGRIESWECTLWSAAHSTRPAGAADAGNFVSAQLIGNAIARPQAIPIPQPRGDSDRNAVPLYRIPNVEVRRHRVTSMPIRASSLRTLGAYANVVAAESCMDKLALAAGLDPIEFRIRHLDDQRAVLLLQKLRELVRWSDGLDRQYDGRGIGFARYKNSAAYCAVASFVTLDRATGLVRCKKVVSVTDAGKLINPDGARNQLEGGIIQSVSWTLKERVRFDQRQLLSRHWGEYPVIRFSEVPALETHLVDRPDQPSLGLGEASPGPAGASMANAVANALGGQHLDGVPYTSESVLRAIAAGSADRRAQGDRA